jgi:hypothetical protein
MTTALDIIKRSLRMLGVYSAGEDLDPSEAQDGLAALNDLVEELSIGGMVYAKTRDSIGITAGLPSITVGPSGTTITDRPVQVLDESYMLIGTTSYPLQVLTLQQFTDIQDKTTQGIPEGVFPRMDMPNATLSFWPVPNQAMTLQLWSSKVLASFPGLTTEVSLPPGYKKALAFLLAIDIASEYEAMPSPLVLRGATNARRMIETLNFQVPMLTLPAEIGQQWGFNILTNTVG